MVNDANIISSKFSFRIKQIESIYNSIVNYPYYALSSYEINIITSQFGKSPSTVLDITNFDHIWFLLGPNVRLRINEFNTLKNVVTSISDKVNQSHYKYFEAIEQTHLSYDNNTQLDELILDNLHTIHLSILDLYEQLYILIEEFHRLIKLYKSIYVDLSINNLNNDYKVKLSTEWFYNLISIYEKYNGPYPTNSISLFNYLKKIYSDITDYHAVELVEIIDFHLGGKGYSNIIDIARNFEWWMKRNYDTLNERIRTNIILTI